MALGMKVGQNCVDRPEVTLRKSACARERSTTADALDAFSCCLGQEREKHLTKPTREIYQPTCIIAQFP
jgi:hypothetical protein